MNRRAGDKRDNWLLIKHRDAAARPNDGDALLAQDHSVGSGCSMAMITAGDGGRPKPFMLAVEAPAPSDGVWRTRENPASTAAAPKPAQIRMASPGGPMPRFVEPELCQSGARAPAGAGWAHEIKFDGYRMQRCIEGARRSSSPERVWIGRTAWRA